MEKSEERISGIGIPLFLFEKGYEPTGSAHNAVADGMGLLWGETIKETFLQVVTGHVETSQVLQDAMGAYSLTQDEATAIVYYTSDARTLGGTCEQSPFRVLNMSLATRNMMVLEKWKTFLYYLIGGLEKLPDVACEVYRTLNEPMTQLSKQYKVGNTVVWVSFTSTSKKRTNIDQFAQGNSTGTWMILDVIEGKDVSDFSLFPKSEVLLMPNAVFRVDKVMQAPSNMDVIFLQQQKTPDNTKITSSRKTVETWTNAFGFKLSTIQQSTLKIRKTGPPKVFLDANSPEFALLNNLINSTILTCHYTYQAWPYDSINLYSAYSLLNPNRLKVFESILEPKCLAVHGTSLDGANSILSEGFRPSAQGSFGQGVYLGENGSVAVVFAQHHHGSSCRARGVNGKDYIAFMSALICLVKPGKVDTATYTTSLPNAENIWCGKYTLNRKFTVTKDRLSNNDALIGTNQIGYREIVLYDNSRIYPVYEINFWPNYKDVCESTWKTNSHLETHQYKSSWDYFWANAFVDGRPWEGYPRESLVAAFKSRQNLLSEQFHIRSESGPSYSMRKTAKTVEVESVYYEVPSFSDAPVLHWAVHFQIWCLVSALLEAGADKTQLSKGGVLPADLLVESYLYVTSLGDSKKRTIKSRKPVPSDIAAQFQ